MGVNNAGSWYLREREEEHDVEVVEPVELERVVVAVSLMYRQSCEIS